ncbi:hydantoinase/oxoprolinase family protein [Marivita sp.]|uniref:hydantoinase/oxoprolinase family protein n=1 Tax=Marivita sp. TaxID=2003365 RepID=UPI002615FBD0|nr:hydantoinase/oxoprolinase family protein [Marivita sp.]
MAQLSISVDIGGTFTDVVLRGDDGSCWVDKTLTTTDDLQVGFFKAITAVLEKAGYGPSDVTDLVVHATTVVTNAIIERKGPRTALVVTEGFRDVLTIRDECRSDIFDNQLEVPSALIPPEMTFGIRERTRGNGEIHVEPVLEEIEDLVHEVVSAGVTSVAVCLLNSYRNAANERLVGETFERLAPEIFLSLSSDVAPQMREYPRASTTALNAFTKPIVKPYLDGLAKRLREAGFGQDLLIMLSSGGVIGAAVAGENPVRMIESGPAAGALAASYFADTLDLGDVVSFDMGGTTAKACFIKDAQPLITGDFEVDRIYRFQHGSGFPVTVPCIDMIEIGAGGGSLASKDSMGLLKVGPQSAGSKPGPVCYGRGGMQPTVTDADLCLGMLDAGNFLGGEMSLDEAGSRKTLAVLGNDLGLDADQVAVGIFELVGESMASAIRSHATDRGVDWRGVPLLAFGGAGPVHACYVADLLDSGQVIYPPLASVLSAFGNLVTPVRLDLARSDIFELSAIDWDAADAVIEEMQTEGRAALTDAGCATDAITMTISGDIRYAGQHNELTVPLTGDIIGRRKSSDIRQLFEDTYEKKFGVRLEELEVELVAWRVSATGPEIKKTPPHAVPLKSETDDKSRRVRFPEREYDVPVIPRAEVASGQKMQGPLIIEERETTIVILPGWSVEVNGVGCIVATKEEPANG